MGTLTRDGFEQLTKDDIAWLMKQPPSLERDHIKLILERVTGLYYDRWPAGFVKWVDAEHGDYAKTPS